MRRSLSVFLVSGLLATSLSFAQSTGAQATSELASFAPDTTVFYAEFELDQASDQLIQSADLLDRANLPALLAAEDANDIDDAIGVASLLADGQAAVFVTDVALANLEDVTGLAADAVEVGAVPEEAVADEIPEGWALVVMPTDVTETFDLYYEIAFGESEVAPTDVDYNGYTISVVEPVDEYSSPMAMAQVDDVIVFSTTATGIENVIDTTTGENESLAESAQFTDVRAALESDVMAFGYVNGPAILNALEDIPELDAAIGSDEIAASYDTYSGFVFWADDAGFRMDSIAMPGEGVTFATGTPYEAAYAGETPADVLFFSSGTDLGQSSYVQSLAIGLGMAIIGVDEDTADMMSTPVTDPEALADEIFAEVEDVAGFNMKTDLLDQMVGEWAMSGTVGSITSELPDVSALFVTQIEDTATVQTVVDTITQKMTEESDASVEITTRDVNGTEVTSINMDDDEITLVLEFGVVDDQMMIGINDGMNFGEMSQAGSLADDAVYGQTFDALPGDNLTYSSYISMAQALPLIDEMIASSSMSELDADPSCGDYATQEEAQAAYDEDPFENWMLDMNFDDVACTDYFAPASPEAEAMSMAQELNILSIGSVSFTDGSSVGSSMIILIGS